MTKDSLIQQAFEVAAERYAVVGVDVRKALEDIFFISTNALRTLCGRRCRRS